MPITSIKEQGVPWASVKGQGPKKTDDEKLKKACMDFESVFIQKMFKAMRQTIPKSGLLGEGPGKDIFESLFDQELSKSLAQRDGLGLGKVLYHQMLQQRERTSSPSTELKLLSPNENISKEETRGD